MKHAAFVASAAHPQGPELAAAPWIQVPAPLAYTTMQKPYPIAFLTVGKACCGGQGLPDSP